MQIGIIGEGRFGTLWRDMLTEAGLDVRTCDRDEDMAWVSKVDILFLAVPISQIGVIATGIRGILKEDTIVADVGSVKMRPVEDMRAALPETQPIIGTHPLFGPDSVRRLGSIGRKIVITKVRQTEEQLESLRDICGRLGLSIIESTPEEHDEQMARSQTLVHFIGRALLPLGLSEQRIATPAYQTLLDLVSMVENDTEELFLDMQRQNPYAAAVRRQFIRSVHDVQETI